jgi:hypothetical protein
MPVEGISNSFEDLSFNVINVREMTATRRAPNRKPHMKLLLLFLITLTRNIKSRDIQTE